MTEYALDNANTGADVGSFSISLPAACKLELKVWLRPSAWVGGNPGLFRDGSGFGSKFFIFQGSSGRPWIRWGGDILKPGSGYSLPLNEWTQVWFSVESGGAAFFATRTDGADSWTTQHSAAGPASSPGETFMTAYGWQSTSGEKVLGLHNRIEIIVNDTPTSLWLCNEGSGTTLANEVVGGPTGTLRSGMVFTSSLIDPPTNWDETAPTRRFNPLILR